MPRKQPFSGKQKKKQLQERRERKKGSYGDDSDEEVEDGAAGEGGKGRAEIMRVHEQPVIGKDFDPNRYRLMFLKITPEEMKKRKEAAGKPIIKVAETDLEMSMESVHIRDDSLDFPKRPPWDFSLSKEQLEKQEQSYFQNYLQTMLTSHDPQQLSYFELNLETWRQLWRVTEISDMLLLIADIRYPALNLPPSLYRYLREELKREVIVVLNKVDLAPPALVAAWKAYLNSVFPEAHIVCFASFPKTAEATGTGLRSKQKKKAVSPLGPQQLLDVCRELVGDQVNLDSWQHKLDTKDSSTSAPEKHDDSAAHGNPTASQSEAAAAYSVFAGVYQKFRDGILTIGCIGYPNVGKSSLLNRLVGKKVVSVSRTPGHTKHLQTIFLTPTVKLCDCPGLVFPSYVDKSLQILSGIFPIAQVREPYSAVGYLAQRLDLPRLLHLSHPDMAGQPPTAHSQELPWSAYDICEAWAVKCGYFTAKASRPDMYRAANQILRMAVEGRLRLCLAPPNYFQKQDTWMSDPFAAHLTEQLTKQALAESSVDQQDESGSESDSETENQSESIDGDLEEGATLRTHSNPFALLPDA